MKTNSSFVIAFLFLLVTRALAQAPVIGQISGPSVVCYIPAFGSQFSVFASNSPTGYSWTVSPNTGVTSSISNNTLTLFFPNNNWTYTITCSATNASGTSQQVVKVVNVYKKPTVTFSGNNFFCQGSSTNISASPTTIQGSSTINSASSTLFFTWSPGTGLNTTIGPNVIANPSVTTTYTVSIMNGPCTSTAPYTVMVLQTPTVTVNSGSICAGSSFTMVPNGADSYMYPTGSPVVSPTLTTSYIITGTTLNGCSDTAISVVDVKTVPVSVSSSQNEICLGESAVLSANGANSFAWSTGANTSSISVSPTGNTDYTVTGTDANGCMASMVITQSVSACLGIQQASAGLRARLYPNPVSGVLSVELEDTGGKPFTMRLTNALGQMVMESENTAARATYDLSRLPAGVYFITLKQAAAVTTLKLIKE